jgi:hypothetical protein
MIKQAQHSLTDLLHHDIIFNDKDMQSQISAGGMKSRIELRTDCRMFTASTSSQSKAASAFYTHEKKPLTGICEL